MMNFEARLNLALGISEQADAVDMGVLTPDTWADGSTFGTPQEIQLTQVRQVAQVRWDMSISEPPVYLPQFLMSGAEDQIGTILAVLKEYCVNQGYPVLVKMGFINKNQRSVHPLQIAIEPDGSVKQGLYALRQEIANPIYILAGIRTEEGVMNLHDIIRAPIEAQVDTSVTTDEWLNAIRNTLDELKNKGFIKIKERSIWPAFKSYLEITFNPEYFNRLEDIMTDPSVDPETQQKAEEEYGLLKQNPFDLVGMFQIDPRGGKGTGGQGFYIMNRVLDADPWMDDVDDYFTIAGKLLDKNGPIMQAAQEQAAQQTAAAGVNVRANAKRMFRDWLRQTGQGTMLRSDAPIVVTLLTKGLSSNHLPQLLDQGGIGDQTFEAIQRLPDLPLIAEEMKAYIIALFVEAM